jgi:hypothetical protein
VLDSSKTFQVLNFFIFREKEKKKEERQSKTEDTKEGQLFCCFFVVKKLSLQQ